MYLYIIGCNNDLHLYEVVFPNDSLIIIIYSLYYIQFPSPVCVFLDLFNGFAHFLFKCFHHLHKSEFKVIFLCVRCVVISRTCCSRLAGLWWCHIALGCWLCSYGGPTSHLCLGTDFWVYPLLDGCFLDIFPTCFLFLLRSSGLSDEL